MAKATVALMISGRCLFGGLAAFIDEDLLGFAAGADGHFHQTLHARWREVVESGDGDVEEDREEGEHGRRLRAGGLREVPCGEPSVHKP